MQKYTSEEMLKRVIYTFVINLKINRSFQSFNTVSGLFLSIKLHFPTLSYPFITVRGTDLIKIYFLYYYIGSYIIYIFKRQITAWLNFSALRTQVRTDNRIVVKGDP